MLIIQIYARSQIVCVLLIVQCRKVIDEGLFSQGGPLHPEASVCLNKDSLSGLSKDAQNVLLFLRPLYLIIFLVCVMV